MATLLLDVIVRFDLLIHIINSVIRSKKQLLVLFCLICLIAYLFSVVAVMFLSELFKTGRCETLSVCFAFILNRTFMYDGGMGGFLNSLNNIDSFSDVDNYDFQQDLGIILFGQLNNLIVLLLLEEIVTGIITDTFALLREEDEAKLEDMTMSCFVCNQKRETLDKHALQNGFSHHVYVDHNMWNYLFYISYLRNKSKTELNGIESYVYDKIVEGDPSWFPYFYYANDEEREQTKEKKEGEAKAKAVKKTNGAQRMREDQKVEMLEVLDETDARVDKMEELVHKWALLRNNKKRKN